MNISQNELRNDLRNFTPMLTDNNNQTLVNAQYNKITISEDESVTMKKAGWIFDWSLLSNSTVIESSVSGSQNIQGLVAYDNKQGFTKLELVESAPYNRGNKRQYQGVGKVMFTIVAYISFLSGNDGFVMFTPKTRLHDYYARVLGAKDIGNGNQFLDTTASWNLIKQFGGQL